MIKKLAESLSLITDPNTERLDEVNNSTQEVGETIKKSQPTLENTNISRSLLDTLTHMKVNKNFFKLVEEGGGKVFWNKIPVTALGENRISTNDQEYDINPNIQKYFTNTKKTTKHMDNEDKLTVYNIPENIDFYSMRHTKGLNSARMKDALYNLPKEIDKIRNPPLPAIYNLQGEGVKIIIPSNIIDIYTRLEVLLGLKLSGHTNTLTEASNLIDELYKRGEIQNKQQYRNALDKFFN